VTDEWVGDTEGTRRDCHQARYHASLDWKRVPSLDPTASHLAGQLDCLRFIRAGLEPEAAPDDIQSTGTGQESCRETICWSASPFYQEPVVKGLEAIAETTRRPLWRPPAGNSGVLHAIQHARRVSLNAGGNIKTFGLPQIS